MSRLEAFSGAAAPVIAAGLVASNDIGTCQGRLGQIGAIITIVPELGAWRAVIRAPVRDHSLRELSGPALLSELNRGGHLASLLARE